MGMFRSLQNVTRRYSPAQIKARDATCNDGTEFPSPDDLFEVARYAFNSEADMRTILELLERRLNDKGKNWLHVSKSMIVLNYLMVAGPPHVLTWARDKIHHISSLSNFKFVTADGDDAGKKVREATEQCVRIFSNDGLRRELRQELVALNPAIKELCRERRAMEYQGDRERREGRELEERQALQERQIRGLCQAQREPGERGDYARSDERSFSSATDLSSQENDGELGLAIEMSKAEARAVAFRKAEEERLAREEEDAALERARQAYLDQNMHRKRVNGLERTMPSLLIDIDSDSASSSSSTPHQAEAPTPLHRRGMPMETMQPPTVPWSQARLRSSPSQFSQQQPRYQTPSPSWNQICAPLQTPRYQRPVSGLNYQNPNAFMYPDETDMSFQPVQYARRPPPPPPRLGLLQHQLTGWAAPPPPPAPVSGDKNPFLTP